MYVNNSSMALDHMTTADVTTNVIDNRDFKEPEDRLQVLYLMNITKMMWTYIAPILLFIGTTGNVTSAIIMIRYVHVLEEN